ncbi:unnamed protein product [Laminaria digitata]
MTELLPGARIPSKLLTGAEEQRYIKRLQLIMRRARLNLHYPEARALASHIGAMAPTLHQGLYPGVEMNLRSGLPTYKEWTRVQTDVALAPDQLRQLGSRAEMERKAARNPDSIHAKQLRKIDYYSGIQKTSLAVLGEMSVALRRVEPEEGIAWFHVILDKLDASGLFVRYAIDLSQKSSNWGKQVVTLDEENARHTEEFQSLIYKFTSLDAEFTQAKLNAIGSLQVERVAKGTVGPFYFSPEQAPAGVAELFEHDPDGFVAMFSLDMVAQDLAEDRDNDPLDDLLMDKLSDEARRGYEMARERYQYKCFKDRKFVVPRTMQRAMQDFCAQHGTKNIIYTA